MAGGRTRPRDRDPRRAPPPGRGGRAAWWVAGLALAGLALAIVLARRPQRSDAPAALAPVQAFERGLALAQAGHDLESLPYFERALSVGAAAPAPVRNAYTAALHNAVLHARRVERFGRRTTRSSVERVRLTAVWLRHLDQLEAAATDPSRRAFLTEVRSSTLAMWGFPLDADAEHARARSLDPSLPARPPDEP